MNKMVIFFGILISLQLSLLTVYAHEQVEPDFKKVHLTCTAKFENPGDASESFMRTHEIFSVNDGVLTALIEDGVMFKNYTTTKIHVDTYSASSLGQEEALEQLAVLAQVKQDEISSIEVYGIEPGFDGSIATIAIFKDAHGRVLGKAGTFGWYAARCEDSLRQRA